MKTMTLTGIFLVSIFAFPIVVPVSGPFTALSPVPVTWAAPNCDADGDGSLKEKGRCGGEDSDDNDPCIPDDSVPACTDSGSGGGGIMTLVPVDAQWAGVINEAAPRHCNANYGNASNGGVNYGCVQPPQVKVDPLSPSNGGQLCSLLETAPGLILGGQNASPINDSRITTYAFSVDPTWNESACVDNAECLTRMTISAYFDNWCENSKCGRLVIFHGWGNAIPAGGGELNPFTTSQVIYLDDLTVTFKGIGKNRTVATCSYPGQGVTFSTTP